MSTGSLPAFPGGEQGRRLAEEIRRMGGELARSPDGKFVVVSLPGADGVADPVTEDDFALVAGIDGRVAAGEDMVSAARAEGWRRGLVADRKVGGGVALASSAEMAGYLAGRRPQGRDDAMVELTAADPRIGRLMDLHTAARAPGGYILADEGDPTPPRLGGTRTFTHVDEHGVETEIGEDEAAWSLMRDRLDDEVQETYRRDPGRTRRWHMQRIAKREGLHCCSRRVKIPGGGVTVSALGRTAAEARDILMRRLEAAGFVGREIGLPLAIEREDDR
ncbi:hypothetical protein J3S89_02910 [Pinisolibacter sp. B13]|uniref:hypothetical protein n=2 Tax=Pinisolibacter aquiterrae TaxID=2815579 RepID=UPI001C3D62C8|nr:hypothetical protein [Pinisolibacter aquiterrae]MBV5262982.1 hypothetical protein [Pinisolibacter aquiterrae]MCC8235323.1 hypothetical protein [Pinisolibacter aquiterrae]